MKIRSLSLLVAISACLVPLVAQEATAPCPEPSCQEKWEADLSTIAYAAQGEIPLYFLAPSHPEDLHGAEYGTRDNPRPQLIGTLTADDIRALLASEVYPETEFEMQDCAYLLDWKLPDGCPPVDIMLPPCDVPVIALCGEYYEVWLINPSMRKKILNFIDRYHRQQPSPEATTRLPDASDGADDSDDSAAFDDPATESATPGTCANCSHGTRR